MASVTSYNVKETEEQNIHSEQKNTDSPGFFNEILNWASQRDVHWFIAQASKPCVLWPCIHGEAIESINSKKQK